MAIAIKSGPVGSIITAAGGVDMRVEDWWNLRKGDHREVPVVNMTVPSLKQPNDELHKMYRSLKIVEPPSPARDLPGWVAPAKGGQQALQYVSIKRDELSQRRDSAEILLQLDKLKKRAEMLDFYDRLINAHTKDRMDAMQELKRLKEASEQKQQELLEEAKELAFSLLLNLRKLDWANAPAALERRNAERFLETVEDLAKIKDLANGFLEEIERTGEGRSDPDRLLKVARELTDDAIAVRQNVMPSSPDWVREGETFSARASARTGRSADWVRAEDVATKASVVAGVTFAAIKIELKSFEYIDVSKRNAELADSLGDRARDLRNIQRMRERYVQEYNVEKRRLEEMMRP
jgi:nucleotide-binding universal stress UspA family protein